MAWKDSALGLAQGADSNRSLPSSAHTAIGQACELPTVVAVEYVPYSGIDRDLRQEATEAMRAGDVHRWASASLERAHRAMVNRDATLCDLVKAIRRGDHEALSDLVDSYGAYHRLFDSRVSLAQDVSEDLLANRSERVRDGHRD
jgi:hypothetical protein